MGIELLNNRIISPDEYPWGISEMKTVPLPIDNAFLWLDGADTKSISLDDSEAITLWKDKSENLWDASQPISGSRPVMTTMNNLPALVFAHDYLSVPDFLFDSTVGKALSFILVGTMSDTSTRYGRLLSIGNSSYSTDYDRASCASVLNRDYGYDWCTSYNSGVSRSAVPLNTPTIFCAVFGETTIQHFINGTAGTARTISQTLNTTAGLAIGTVFSKNSDYWDGSVGEIVSFLGENVSDRQKMEGYLAKKWGLIENLPADHPYK